MAGVLFWEKFDIINKLKVVSTASAGIAVDLSLIQTASSADWCCHYVRLAVCRPGNASWVAR